jgi:hypothetical protein
MWRSSFCRLVAAAAALTTLAGGCEKAAPQPADKAEAALNQVLVAWTQGEPAGTFADPEKPVQVTDPDWIAGYRLLQFLAFESKSNPDKQGRVRCRVSLTLQDPRGKKVDKEVVYEVDLGDRIVIERAGG